MFKLDEQIMRAYFTMEEYQRRRLRLERLFHPEKFKWAKRGAPPPITETKRIRCDVFSKMGFGEEHYQEMLKGEAVAKAELCDLTQYHPVWPHFERINGYGLYLAGAFVAAGGDIRRPCTASSFWKGMGLDVLPDGTVPRRIRGNKEVERRIPALPHVTRIGEQIREQICKSGGKLKVFYDREKALYWAKRPDTKPIWADKHGKRITQKILYANLWEVWRLAYDLPAPWPYAFDILKHNGGHRITIQDLYDK